MTDMISKDSPSGEGDISNIYEHPLNERVRLLMRLELIFAQADVYRSADNRYNAQMFLDALFALLNITIRYELKAEILKELERVKNVFLQSRNLTEADSIKTDRYLVELTRCSDLLHKVNSKHIDSIRNIEFLNIIKNKNTHETGSYFFEIPELQHWLLQDLSYREKQADKWLSDFSPFRESITFLLKLIRNSGDLTEEQAESGIFIKKAQTRIDYQMIRMELLNNNYFPRISGDKNRFAIRFLEQKQADQRPNQVTSNVKFKLQTCII